MTTSQGAIKFDRRTTGDEVLLKLYKGILKPRLIEEKMLLLIRQGKISKWFSGYGQEAVAVGSAAAIHDDEYILPLHRNLGIFTWRNIPLSRLFAQFMGKMSGFSDGRERSFHFGTREFHIVGMISHLAAMLGVADGIALAHKLRGEGRVVLAFSGDGSTSEGDFHEAVNLAAVWDLPVLFIIENNGFGLSTPANEQYRCKALVERAVGYGINGVQVDGNNILDLFHTVSDIAGRMRNKPEPFLLECITFRMRGHEEASGTKYIPREIFDEWKQKDPVINFENYLLSEGLLSPDLILRIKEEMNSKIQNAWDEAFAEPPPVPDTGKELRDIYFPSVNQPPSPPTGKTTKMRFVDAISDALRVSLKRHPDLILMGQDIAGYGGVFKVTEGFYREFGKEKIRNTPLCESAVLGAALGLSISGYKSVVEMQFADFITCGFNQVVNNIAKNYWRWGQNADVVIRMPTGAGVGAGPFHSQSNEAWFF
ncbi:MAG: dehydrogenase, partial [Bacteroidetes bacterium]|nr:dehydrogenase [Bacteroidota bacterium]